jgi:hypothetical protein
MSQADTAGSLSFIKGSEYNTQFSQKRFKIHGIHVFQTTIDNPIHNRKPEKARMSLSSAV